ncbi:hypothetical protein V1264_022571 [Littorina saxatilis]|uniref:ZMYM2-like/QRICH1 C-terminal domain-containing protein n=1 Tax=Littorina saxatilis TaxID=31220 RepID=A0AAN9AKL1_9CAEN
MATSSEVSVSETTESLQSDELQNDLITRLVAEPACEPKLTKTTKLSLVPKVPFNKNTLKKTSYDLRHLAWFMKKQGDKREIQTIQPQELCKILCCYFMNLKKMDDQDYEPSTIKSVLNSIQRHLRSKDYCESVMCSPQFAQLRQVLKTKVKSVEQLGCGNLTNKAQPLKDADVDKLWQSKQLGVSDPEAILNTLWWQNTINFGLYKSKPHRHMQWGDVTLQKDISGREYLQFRDRQPQTCLDDNPKSVHDVCRIAWATNDERCPVAVYKTYAALRPKDYCDVSFPFYCATNYTKEASLEFAWFKRQPVGKNKLSLIMKKMCSKAGIGNQHFTNHSARKYVVQKLSEKKVPPNNVQSVNNCTCSTNSQSEQRSFGLTSSGAGGVSVLSTGPSVSSPAFTTIRFQLDSTTALAHRQEMQREEQRVIAAQRRHDNHQENRFQHVSCVHIEPRPPQQPVGQIGLSTTTPIGQILQDPCLTTTTPHAVARSWQTACDPPVGYAHLTTTSTPHQPRTACDPPVGYAHLTTTSTPHQPQTACDPPVGYAHLTTTSTPHQPQQHVQVVLGAERLTTTTPFCQQDKPHKDHSGVKYNSKTGQEDFARLSPRVQQQRPAKAVPASIPASISAQAIAAEAGTSFMPLTKEDRIKVAQKVADNISSMVRLVGQTGGHLTFELAMEGQVWRGDSKPTLPGPQEEGRCLPADNRNRTIRTLLETISVNTEQPGTVNTLNSEQPRTVNTCNSEQPRTVNTLNSEQPRTVITCNSEQPRTVITCNSEQPRTVITCNSEQPRTVNTCNSEQPRTVNTLNSEQPRTVITCNSEQPRTVNALNSEQPQTVITCNSEQTQTVITCNSEQTQTVKALNSERPRTVYIFNSEQPRTVNTCNSEQPRTVNALNSKQPRTVITCNSEQTQTVNTFNSEQPRTVSALNSELPRTVYIFNSEQSGNAASDNSMEEGDTAVVSDVKIEIDVAEETPLFWHITEPHPYMPAREGVVTENTATMPTVQTLEAAVSTHRDTWLKQEIQTPETQTAVSTHSDTWLFV